MRVLFSGETFVEYAQRFVWGPGWWPDLDLSFGDQGNGLLGARSPGGLVMIVGLHTGDVPLTVELHDAAPPVDHGWEEVVEASWGPRPDGGADFQVTGLNLGVEESSAVEIPPGTYRVRYCASGMDAAHAACGGRSGDEPALDRYLLQLWPDDDERPDEVVRQTSGTAAYWHQVVRERPSLAEMLRVRAEKADRERAEREREDAAARARIERFHEHRMWGGPRPPAPLGEIVEGAAITRLDRALAQALAAAGPDEQRRITRWLLRRGIAEAGLDRVDWLTDAAEAVGRGEPLPDLFAERHGAGAVDRLFTDDRVPHTTVRSLAGDIDNYSGQIGALCSIRPAAGDDPGRAVFGVLSEVATTFGGDRYPILFDELRRAFPALRGPGPA